VRINEFVKKCHKTARDNGFWDKGKETGTFIALVHSEVSEALEADSCAEFIEELADICIWIGDRCGGYDIDLEATLMEVSEMVKKDRPFLNYIDTTSISNLEISMSQVPPDFDDNKHACSVHKCLSVALEADRKGEREDFALGIAGAFMMTFIWGAQKGYYLEDAIKEKMERNKKRGRLHGKRY